MSGALSNCWQMQRLHARGHQATLKRHCKQNEDLSTEKNAQSRPVSCHRVGSNSLQWVVTIHLVRILDFDFRNCFLELHPPPPNFLPKPLNKPPPRFEFLVLTLTISSISISSFSSATALFPPPFPFPPSLSSIIFAVAF